MKHRAIDEANKLAAKELSILQEYVRNMKMKFIWHKNAFGELELVAAGGSGKGVLGIGAYVEKIDDEEWYWSIKTTQDGNCITIEKDGSCSRRKTARSAVEKIIREGIKFI